MPLPDPYAASGRLAEMQDQNRNVGQVAEMGAQQLERYGPSGVEWAKRLRSDPNAAMAMAQQYGGFAQLEQNLAYQGAAGRGANAQDLATVGLQHEGAKGYKDILDSSQGASSALKQTQVMKLRGEAIKASQGWITRREFYVAAAAASADALAADPKDRGSSDFALINAMGKLIDPGSVVRNEEGEAIAAAGSDSFATAWFKAMKWFGQTGIIEPGARMNLLRQIDALYQAETDEQYNRYQGTLGEMQSLSGAQGIIQPEHLQLTVPWAIDPDSEKYSPVSIDLEGWREDIDGAGAEDVFESTPLGGEFTIGGVRYQKTHEDRNNEDAYREVE